ncbi:MAG: hypothetical protein EOP88_21500 [Verrucomicrobiaceae bacterium]|nr:MAG: hypothetical protein EOP88_21500 [Verrucomicrobiaceae bacterium]
MNLTRCKSNELGPIMASNYSGWVWGAPGLGGSKKSAIAGYQTDSQCVFFMGTTMLLNFKSPCGSHLLTLEADGKVAYAYLQSDGSIVGDLWLYNQASTPLEPEWRDRKNIPFSNSREFVVDDGKLDPEPSVGDVRVEWKSDDRGTVAYIYFSNVFHGVVGVGDRPGYARLAGKDGPVARVLVHP